MLKVFEGSNDDEILITRHGQFDTAINVVNIYGPQECRTGKDKVKDNWAVIMQEVIKIEAKGEYVVVIGDYHICDLIDGNENDKVTNGGELVREFLDNGDYILVNASDRVSGGPFTRYDPADPDNDLKKSALSFCIISKELYQYVGSMTIDKEKHFTPFRTLSRKKVTFTDHYSIELIFHNIPLKPINTVVGRKVSRWNTRKEEGGWENYNKMTTNNASIGGKKNLLSGKAREH